jgi:hypothetical protein
MNFRDRLSDKEEKRNIQAFTVRILNEGAKTFKQAQTTAIDQYNLEQTGNMKSNRPLSWQKSGEGASFNMELPVYMRFLDMRRNQGGKKGKMAPKFPIYNRLIMGNLSRMERRLMSEYSSAIMESLPPDFKIEL